MRRRRRRNELAVPCIYRRFAFQKEKKNVALVREALGRGAVTCHLALLTFVTVRDADQQGSDAIHAGSMTGVG
jgi:hypothetical protein